jgi:hypothetical protein
MMYTPITLTYLSNWYFNVTELVFLNSTTGLNFEASGHPPAKKVQKVHSKFKIQY